MMFFNLLRSLPILLIISTRRGFAYQPIGRWGHSIAVTTAGIFVYGGKTDQYNSYSYTSAPNSNDLLFLPLNSTFDSTSPPWKLLNVSSNVSGRSGPPLAWHTLSIINDSYLMVFGGQPGPDSPTQSFSLAGSTYFLNIADLSAPYWVSEPQSWGSEPTRRIRHSSTPTDSSSLLIIGGERADGSNNAFPDNYAFDMSAASFLALSNTTGPANIFDHRSVMLSDGRLLVLGGYDQSRGALVPFSDIWSFDARNTTSTWSLLTPSVTNLPTPRRAFAATLLYNNKVLIHGGADAVLQQNYDDGWILDTSSDPMIWSKVNTLTQLGSRHDHFAASSGAQVLFGFGYSGSGPSSPALYLYDVTKDAFVTTFAPSPSLSASSLPPSAPTGSHHGFGTSGVASLTGTGAPASTNNPDPQNTADVGSKSTKTIALAVVFSVLGAVVVIVVLYYMRRRHQRRGQFVSLVDDDADSARSRSIPAVVMIDDNHHSERRSRLRIFPSFHLPNVLANSNSELPPRRDMLADEDAYDSEWYHLKRIRDSDASWSFRSFMGTRLRGQERSSTTNGSIRSHKHETSDPLLNDYSAYEEAGLLERKERCPDPVVKSLPPYQDPFVDPAEHEDKGATSPDMHSSPIHVASFPTDSLSLNFTASESFGSGFSRKPPDPPTERLDSIRKNTFPHNTDIASTTTYATSLINANRGPFQPISPTDPWWRRFTRHSFLDRKLSTTSKKSPSIDYKECNATLMSIEEQTDTLALKEVATRSVEIVNNHVKTKSMSNLYDKTQHGKSFSSFQTANTEAIENIGRMVDVVQRDRTSSRRSSSSSVGVTSFDGQQTLFKSDDPSAEYLTASTSQLASPQVDTSETPKDVETDLVTSSPMAQDRLGGLVAARVRAYERKFSQDNESPIRTRKDTDENKVKYGLAPRQSLFVANPDG